MIWKVSPGEWKTDVLITFTFADQPPDLDRSRNNLFWRERFGNDRTHQPLRNSSRLPPVAESLEVFPPANPQDDWEWWYSAGRPRGSEISLTDPLSLQQREADQNNHPQDSWP